MIAIIPLAGHIGRATEDRPAWRWTGRASSTPRSATRPSRSSTQIALFVAPVLVFLSYAIAPAPMDLLFTAFEIIAVVLAVLSISLIAHDGETHWMEGVQLLAVYAILVLGFYFLPPRA